jgi:hypothetical protein
MSTGHSKVTYCCIKGFIRRISLPFVNGSAQEAMFVEVGGLSKIGYHLAC